MNAGMRLLHNTCGEGRASNGTMWAYAMTDGTRSKTTATTTTITRKQRNAPRRTYQPRWTRHDLSMSPRHYLNTGIENGTPLRWRMGLKMARRRWPAWMPTPHPPTLQRECRRWGRHSHRWHLRPIWTAWPYPAPPPRPLRPVRACWKQTCGVSGG